MGLIEVQTLLARLYMDGAFRERFANDRLAVGREFDLSGDELRQVEQISWRQLSFFANALLHKRLHGVVKLLPLSHAIMGDAFYALFRRYVGTYSPSGTHKHRDDALAFAAFLERLAPAEPLRPPSLHGQLRYEAAWLRAADGRPCFFAGYFRHPIVCSTSRSGGGTRSAPRSHCSAAFWLRITPRGRLWHIMW